MKNIPNNLLLCAKLLARRHGINLRNPHAQFNFFSNNRGLNIVGYSKSKSAGVTGGDTAVSQTLHLLNQHSVGILFDKLQYIFQWTDFAATEEFKDICIKYVASTIGASLNVDIDTPAPLINSRIIDKSALRDPLDKCGQGKAFLTRIRQAR